MPIHQRSISIAGVRTSSCLKAVQLTDSSPAFYDRNGLERYTKLAHKVRRAVWDEDSSQWQVEVEDLLTGKLIHDSAEVLVNATGFLNKWTWPRIEGIERFSRPKVHSAAWNAAIQYEGKTIGVIGTGSSAIQVS